MSVTIRTYSSGISINTRWAIHINNSGKGNARCGVVKYSTESGVYLTRPRYLLELIGPTKQ